MAIKVNIMQHIAQGSDDDDGLVNNDVDDACHAFSAL